MRTSSGSTSALARLQPLLAPASVAIVGASGTPGKYGNTVVRYLQGAGFAGRIYPVNPEGGVYEGLTFYRSLAEVPERIDCAFTVIPAAATPGVVRQAAAAGVRALILGASGFAEMGTEAGRQRQAEIAEVASAAGIVVLGPNTNGIWNAHHGLALGYNTSHGEPMRKGPISIAAHSGALFDSFITRLTRFGGGFAKLVPLGNEAMLDMLDMLEALIEDPQTRVIGLIMEAIGDGTRFKALAARARAAAKPIFVLKLGRSAAGATAAIAHSSRLAGSFRAYEALMRAEGVPIVRSIETLAAVCTLASDERALRLAGDTRLVGVSGSGGGCSLLADHAAERGIALAGDGTGAWTGETARAIAAHQGIGLVRNPIDGGNLHGWEKLPGVLAAMERDGIWGPLAGFAHRLPTLGGDLALLEPIVERKQRTGAPAIMIAPGALRPDVQTRYAEAGIPVFSDVATGMDSLKAIYEANDFAVAPSVGQSAGAPQPLAPDLAAQARALLSAAAHRDFLTEIESAGVLRLAGVPMVETRRVGSLAEADRAAEHFGYPLVMKAIAPGIAHKNEAGLVIVGIADATGLAAAFAALVEKTAIRQGTGPGAEIIVQPLVPARAELIVGTTFEPGLGHFLLAGLGGIDAELYDTFELIPVPTPREEIARRLGAARVAPHLDRLARRTVPDLATRIAGVLDGLQALVLAVPDAIQSIDVNPLLVGPSGLTAVDALIVPRRA